LVLHFPGGLLLLPTQLIHERSISKANHDAAIYVSVPGNQIVSSCKVIAAVRSSLIHPHVNDWCTLGATG